MRELPSGWVSARLADFCEVYQPPTISKSQLSSNGLYPVYGANGVIGRYDEYNHEDSQLLITCRGATCGSVNISEPKSWINGNAMVVQPNKNCAELKFAEYFFRGAADYSAIISGSAQPQITRQTLAPTLFPLPPLPEQRRIVRKLDTLTARTTTARTHLTAIKKLVERYKNRMIVKAYSGRLTRPDREYVASDKEGLWDIPDQWQWQTIGDVAEIQPCLTPVSEIQDLPHIAPDNIEKNTGKLLDYRTIGEDGVISAKHKFFKGQIVYSKIRPYLRKAVLSVFDGACSADMYPISVKSNCALKYLFYWLLSEDFSYFTSLSDGRTVLPKINMKQLNAAPVPWCEIDEQHEIVRRIETAFAKIDRLAAEAKKALKHTDRLDQRILAKAFAGELVPQDPNDEPAEILLARIRAERAAPKARRGRETRK
ncbi:restriction endonuclease subunit S [Paracoccus methylarcula]|uniref:Restriction endonuclease subunit S n=1 Tax=Paracoccus methylarcula TaxID=72022 RepID=A0A422R1C8_9RHOB|nr:restriction endonuclease subunit S [Paracoccus methylarcula]RNF36058.1 restriction endonuclease subunit S [Paracoccus methylarcula]